MKSPLNYFYECRLSFDPSDDNQLLLLHPVLPIIVYRGNIDFKTKLPHGQGMQYRAVPQHKQTNILIDGTPHQFGKPCRLGKWNQGYLEGYGLQWYKNGCMYKGNFHIDEPNGKGIFYNKYKKLDQCGTWRDGSIYEGYGTIFYKDKTRYKGYAIQGKRHGSGILFDENGKELKCGIWQHDTFIPI